MSRRFVVASSNALLHGDTLLIITHMGAAPSLERLEEVTTTTAEEHRNEVDPNDPRAERSAGPSGMTDPAVASGDHALEQQTQLADRTFHSFLRVEFDVPKHMKAGKGTGHNS